MDPSKLSTLTLLFEDAARALGHIDSDAPPQEGTDWPIGYAEHLVTRLPAVLGVTLSKSELVRCLLNAAHEYAAAEQPGPWSAFFAAYFCERMSACSPAGRDRLALYHFEGCPYCVMVRREIDRLGIEVELRDIHRDAQHRADLIAARGRRTVPVLRIVSPDGTERWLPESRDIIRILQASYA